MNPLLYALVFGSVAQFGIILPALASYRPYFLLSLLAIFVFAFKKDKREIKLPQTKYVLLLPFTYAASLIQYGYLTGVIDGFLFWFKKTVVFYIAVNIFDSVEVIKRAIWFFLASVAVLIYLGWDMYLYKPELLAHENRLNSYGNYNLSNSFGLLLTVSWPLAFGLLEIEKSFLKKMILIVFMTAVFITCVYTKSRGSLIGMNIGILLCLIFSKKMIKSRFFKVTAMGSVVIVFFVFAVAVIMTRSDVTGMTGAGGEASSGDRLLAWKAAILMALDKPLFGVGWNMYTEYCRDYGLDKKLIAHNTILSVLAETGFIGVFIFVKILYHTIKELIALVKYYKNKAEHLEFYILSYSVAISLFCFFFNTMFSVKDYDPTLWFLLLLTGAIWGCHVRREEELAMEGERV